MDVKQGAGIYNGHMWTINTGFRYGPQSRRSTQVLGEENWYRPPLCPLAIMQKHDRYLLSKQYAGEAHKGTLLTHVLTRTAKIYIISLICPRWSSMKYLSKFDLDNWTFSSSQLHVTYIYVNYFLLFSHGPCKQEKKSDASPGGKRGGGGELEKGEK